MSEATAALGSRTELTASTVSLYANIAQLEVAAMLPHTELLATQTLVLGAGSNATVLPGDLGEIVDVVRTNSFDSFAHRVLTQVPLREIDDASEGTQTGVANRFATSANSILFYPTTTSVDTFTLRYVKVPSDMTNTTDAPSLHTRYDPAILYKLCENLADRVLDTQRAAYYRNKCISVLGTVPQPTEAKTRAGGS